jgi:hypothetical protein
LPVAVLIVNYETYDDLDRALTSLAPFLRPDDEVVVIDQASRPGGLDVVARRHPRTVFVPSPVNVGFAAGVNLAARSSSAPFLMWLNPDTEMRDPVVEHLEAWLIHHPETGVVAPRVLNEDGSVQPSARRFPGMSTAIAGRSSWLSARFPENWLTRWNLPARRAVRPVRVDWVAGACAMTPRHVFEALGGLDESFFMYWEDADYCRRAASQGWTCVYQPGVAVRHAGGRSVARDPAPAIRAFHASAFRYYRKHAGPIGRLLSPVARIGLLVLGEFHARRAARARPPA